MPHRQERRVGKLSDNWMIKYKTLTKYKKEPEMNIITEMKNTLERINSRLAYAESISVD